jgi:hypothetical protein
MFKLTQSIQELSAVFSAPLDPAPPLSMRRGRLQKLFFALRHQQIPNITSITIFKRHSFLSVHSKYSIEWHACAVYLV